MEIKKKERKKEWETPQNCTSPTNRLMGIATVKSMTEYTHIQVHPYAKFKQLKKNRKQ